MIRRLGAILPLAAVLAAGCVSTRDIIYKHRSSDRTVNCGMNDANPTLAQLWCLVTGGLSCQTQKQRILQCERAMINQDYYCLEGCGGRR